MQLLAKANKTARVALLGQQYDVRVTGRATTFSYSEEAIGMECRSAHFKAKPLRKGPSDSEDELAYLTRLVGLMIADDIKEGRYAAANLKEAQATEVSIARQLPVISEQHTAAYSKTLKEEEKAAARELMEVPDDEVLVDLIAKYVGAHFYDMEVDQTYEVVAVQYDERNGLAYYEATSVQVEQGGDGSWAVPSAFCVVGSEVIKDEFLVGYSLMDLTDPENAVLLPEVDEMMAAHTARSRKRGAPEKEGARTTKRKKGGGAGLHVGAKRGAPSPLPCPTKARRR